MTMIAQYQNNLHYQIFSRHVQDIRDYTENKYNELANEDEQGINKGEIIIDIILKANIKTNTSCQCL